MIYRILHWIPILIIGGIISAISIMWYEPNPYKFLKVTVDDPIPTSSKIVPIHVTGWRTKACPFALQQRAYNGNGRKLLNRTTHRPPPSTIGLFDVVTPTRLTDFPTIGLGLYEARVGSKCNLFRHFVPLWGEWFRVELEFVK